MTVEKAKPKQLLRPITTGAGSAMNQSEFLAITCNSLVARQKSRAHGAIGFGFDSHWLKNWRESSKPITKRSNRNHVITFDSHLKTAHMQMRILHWFVILMLHICNIRITNQCKILIVSEEGWFGQPKYSTHSKKYFYVVSTSASIFYILFVKPIRSLLIQRTPAGSSFRLFALTFYSLYYTCLEMMYLLLYTCLIILIANLL